MRMDALSVVEPHSPGDDIGKLRYWSAILLNDPLVVAAGEWDVRERGSMAEVAGVRAGCERAIVRPVLVALGFVLDDGTIVVQDAFGDRNYCEGANEEVRLWNWSRALAKIRGMFPPRGGKTTGQMRIHPKDLSDCYAVVLGDLCGTAHDQPDADEMANSEAIGELRTLVHQTYIRHDYDGGGSTVKIVGRYCGRDEGETVAVVPVTRLCELVDDRYDRRHAGPGQTEEQRKAARSARPSESAS